MKSRLIFIICCLNIAVLGAGYYLADRYWRGHVEQERANANAEIAAAKAEASAHAAAVVRPTVLYKTNQFNWGQLESADYRQYIANLRGVGCPEMTIRDIILTDVMRLYAARRGKVSVNGRDFKFWETDDKRKLKQHQIEERDKQLALIDKELPSVLRELLGINYERELDKYFVDTDEDDRRLAFLSDDKRDQILALRDQFEGQRERIMAQAQNGPLSPGDIEKLKKIDQDRDTALSSLLTPEEKEEYDLSTSPIADRLRKELIGFDPSEAEFRDLFHKQQTIDDAYAYQDMSDETVRAAKAADEAKMNDDIKAELGADRAAQYDLRTNADYQSLCLLTERFDLPADTSKTLLDMRQTAESQKQQLLANQYLTPEQLTDALKAIQTETERATRAALGDSAFNIYSQSADWIHKLGSN